MKLLKLVQKWESLRADRKSNTLSSLIIYPI